MASGSSELVSWIQGKQDLLDAAEVLVHLQDTYQLEIDALSHGILHVPGPERGACAHSKRGPER